MRCNNTRVRPPVVKLKRVTGIILSTSYKTKSTGNTNYNDFFYYYITSYKTKSMLVLLNASCFFYAHKTTRLRLSSSIFIVSLARRGRSAFGGERKSLKSRDAIKVLSSVRFLL